MFTNLTNPIPQEEFFLCEMIDKYEGAKTLEALKEYLKTQSTQKQKNKSTKGSNEKATAKKKDGHFLSRVVIFLIPVCLFVSV